MQSDGSNYCACVNAATLALVDAGIPLRDLVCACSAGLLNVDQPAADLNNIEESSGGPRLTIALLPRSEEIVLLEMDGRLHEDHLEKVVDTATKGCKDIFNLMERRVQDHLMETATSLRTDDL